jgi:hypothetical protein
MITFNNLQENIVYTVKLSTGEIQQISIFSKANNAAHCKVYNHDGTFNTVIKELTTPIAEVLGTSTAPVISDSIQKPKTNLLYD